MSTGRAAAQTRTGLQSNGHSDKQGQENSLQANYAVNPLHPGMGRWPGASSSLSSLYPSTKNSAESSKRIRESIASPIHKIPASSTGLLRGPHCPQGGKPGDGSSPLGFEVKKARAVRGPTHSRQQGQGLDQPPAAPSRAPTGGASGVVSGGASRWNGTYGISGATALFLQQEDSITDILLCDQQQASAANPNPPATSPADFQRSAGDQSSPPEKNGIFPVCAFRKNYASGVFASEEPAPEDLAEDWPDGASSPPDPLSVLPPPQPQQQWPKSKPLRLTLGEWGLPYEICRVRPHNPYLVHN